VDTVLSIYHEFDHRAIRLLQMADPDGFRVWKLLDMDETPTWSRQNTVLLGDACHPVSPFGFSGASMAIEDALTLKTLLPADARPEDVPKRLKLYEEIRKPRVGRVRHTSREIAQGKETKDMIVEYRRFLSEHDAVAHADQVLQKELARKRSTCEPAAWSPVNAMQERKDL
jgi:salicylate hydroxylase